LPRVTGSGPDVASLSGFRWFCRQRAVLYTFSPIRCHAAFANTVVSIRPPFTPADLIDADASLSRDVAFRLLQRVFKIRHTSTNTASAVLARRRGWPCSRCHARCAFNAARFFLFGCKEDSSSVRRSELRVIPRRSASRAEPESPRALLPRATLFKWARGTWETRRPKERSRKEDAACAVESFSLGSFEHLLSPAMRARRDGGPFACWYTSASLAKAFVPIASPRRVAPFRTPQVLFTVGIEWRKGSLPGPPDRTSALRHRASVLQRRASTPFLPIVLARS
jgi:hypothetical protein